MSNGKIYDTKFVTELDEQPPAHLYSVIAEKQRTALLDAMLGAIEPNKKYTVEIKQDYYEDPPRNKAGYKSAIFIEEQIDGE